LASGIESESIDRGVSIVDGSRLLTSLKYNTLAFLNRHKSKLDEPKYGGKISV
jgi:hypothetical protein